MIKQYHTNNISIVKLLLKVALLLLPIISYCQVTSQLDTTQIRIGEEIKLTLQVEVDTTALVLFPEGKTFGALEVLESYKIDTNKINNRYKLIKKYGLTQFDSGSYKLPSLPITIDDRVFKTDSFTIQVKDVPVDTTKQKMFDIKPAVTVKSSNNTFLIWGAIILGIICLAILIFYLLKRKKQKEAQKKLLPPFEEAIEALKTLDQTTLLKENKVKDYYSYLTEIVKRYLDREVDNTALESTTDQLIDRLLLHKDAGEVKFKPETINKLKLLLKRADLVKFAKMSQLPFQLQEDRKTIEEVIIETKEALPQPTEEELLQNEAYRAQQEKIKKRKKIIKYAFGVTSIIILSLISYGAIYGFDNLKDIIFGNKMRELSEARWYKSEYGSPLIIIETPEVLKRVEDSVPQELAMVVKSSTVFNEGDFKDPFFVSVGSILLHQNAQQQEIDLNLTLDNTLQLLEKRGAKNLIVKQETFETEAGIKGVKAFGTFNVEVSKNKILKDKHTYELLLFAQQGGIQTVLVAYQDDGKYAESLKNRIINSVELELTNTPKKEE